MKSTRRKFIFQVSTTAAGAALLPGLTPRLRAATKSANDKLNVAVIGAGGKGSSDTDSVAKLGENIVALCDCDEKTLNGRGQAYPEAKRFRDYRQMLDKMGKEIDAVIVATPDHHHAPAAIMAMEMGKHAYVQKPLTHSVYEARRMREVAKEKKVATQMGNQGSAEPGLRRAVEVIPGPHPRRRRSALARAALRLLAVAQSERAWRRCSHSLRPVHQPLAVGPL